MDILLSFPLQQGHNRPPILKGEQDCLTIESVSIHDHKDKQVHGNGTLYITSHRIIWVSNNTSIVLNLSQVVKVDHKGGKGLFHKSNGKIILNTVTKSSVSYHFGLKVPTSNHIYEQVVQILKSRAWVPTASESRGFNTRNVGVGGLISKQREDAARADSNLKEAFKDMDALMSKAKEMVNLAKKFQKLADKDSSEDESKEFRQLMLDMGIQQPVTKESSGTEFHKRLAKQISTFILPYLAGVNKSTNVSFVGGGMISMADLFCLYNRARGTKLISPEDLLKACTLLESIPDSKIVLKTMQSGVNMVIMKTHSEKVLLEKIGLLSKKYPLTALDVSKKLDVPVALAHDYLLIAEKKEILCRDESIEGLIFYENFFKNYVTPAS